MKARLTFLGTGTSSGIPQLGCTCPVCRSWDPRDKRLRASAYVEYGGLGILVDCGPDFRQQALRAGISHIDGILLTHNHMDHIGGLDDTRALNLCEHHPVNIYCEEYVEQTLRNMYSYAFAEPRYPGAPEWNVHRIEDFSKPFTVTSNKGDIIIEWIRGKGYVKRESDYRDEIPSVEVMPIHGYHLKNKAISVLGYRFGNIAYLTDMNLLEDSEIEKLKGVDAVTINCVKIDPHNSHFSLEEALDFFRKVGAKRSYITHMSHLIPKQRKFARMLPKGVYPAYDGLTIE